VRIATCCCSKAENGKDSILISEQTERELRAAVAYHRRRVGLKSEEPPDEIGELMYRISRVERVVKELQKQQ